MEFNNLRQFQHKCRIMSVIYAIEFDWRTDHTHGAAKSSDQPMDSEQPPVLHSKYHNLQALPVEMLLEIFDQSDLNLADLAEIAQVCGNFNQIVERAFPAKCADDKNVFNFMELWRVEQVFRRFGHLMKSIDLSGIKTDDSDIVIQLMAKYCKNVISLKCVVNYYNTVPCLRRLMPKLEELTITGANPVLPLLFKDNIAYPLKKLHCIGYDMLYLPMVRLPHLIDLSLVSQQYDIGVCYFFMLNREIKALELQYSPDYENNTSTIIKAFPYLQELNANNDMFGLNSGEPPIIGPLGNITKLGVRINPLNDETIKPILQAFREQTNCSVSLSFMSWREYLTDIICSMENVVHVGVDSHRRFGDVGLIRLAGHLQSIDVTWYSRLPLNAIYSALKSTDRLKKANFVSYIWFDDFQTEVEVQKLAAIDATLRKKNIQAQLTLNMRVDSADLEHEVSALIRSFQYFFVAIMKFCDVKYL